MSPRRSLRLAGAAGPRVSDADAASFQQVRQRLFGIAYRVLGSATDVAYFVFTRVRCPRGETGALTIRSENPFWSMFATSNTSKPPGPFAV